MYFKNRPVISFNPAIQMWLVFLVGAGVVRMVLHRFPGMGEDLSDGIIGAFYGVAIACLALGMRRAKTKPKMQ